MPRHNEQEFLNEVLLGCQPAISFCQLLFRISQTLDDLIDKDKPIANQSVIDSYWMALIEIPANSFYRAHEPHLRPIMAAALLDWRDSSILEKEGGSHGQNLAFVMRDQIGSIVSHCAYLIGGMSHMNAVSVKVRQHIHEESLHDYRAELSGASL